MKTKHPKKILALLLAILMVVAILPFSAIPAFAADESIIVTSIEIEAIKPADGVKAKIDEIRIKSVNGDASLADQVSFRANKLFWAEVPNLDPSTWGGNWSKFTGTFEEGKIYSLHFALQSAQPVASSCTVTVYEPNGNLWWQDDIASQDATYVVADAAHEIPAASVISSIELVTDVENPTVGGEIYWPQIKSVNGDEDLVDEVELVSDDSAWWKVFEDDSEKFEGEYFEGGCAYGIELAFVPLNGAEFSDSVSVTLTTPAGTYDMDVMAIASYAECNYLFDQVLDDDTKTVVTSIEITSTVEIDPIAGLKPAYAPNCFTVTKVNGDAEKWSVISDKFLYWYFSDINDAESYDWLYYPEGKSFLGGYYYLFNIDFSISSSSGYLFGEEVDITLITPTKTLKCTYTEKQGDSYFQAYWSFDEKTEGEPLKRFGDTTVSISGYEVGATAGEVAVTVEGEGLAFVAAYGTTYYFYNYTDEVSLDSTDSFEAGKIYSLNLTLYPSNGYTVADFTQKYLNVTMNGFIPSWAEYDTDGTHEYAEVEFMLSPLGASNTVGTPTMSLDNYEIGNKFSDLVFEFSGTGLTVDPNYRSGYCAGDGKDWFEGEVLIEKDGKYLFSIMMLVTDGYGVDGITKDMFVLNGITPYALSTWYDWMEECLLIRVEYKLPVLHVDEGEWHYDATHHWGECSCGEKLDIEAHEFNDSTGKCDMCGCDKPAQTPGGTDTPDGTNTPGGTDTPDDPDDKDGLGAGAIIGIVLGSLAVLGGGGFALYWFVLRKKPTAPVDPTAPPEEAPETDVDIDTEKGAEATDEDDSPETDDEATDTEDTPETEDKKDTE